MNFGPDCECSRLAGLDPRGRLLVTAVFALGVVGLSSLPALLLALLLAALAAVFAGLPLWVTVRRMAALDGFMILALALLPVTVPGEPLLSVGGVGFSRAGTLQAGLILLKANGVVLMTQALVSTLDSFTLSRTLRRLGAPQNFVLLLFFMLRYATVLNGEYQRLRLAMRVRGFVPSTRLHTWYSLGLLFGMLLVRALERGERIGAAMRCRGFTGHFPQEVDSGLSRGWRRPDAVLALVASGGGLLLAAVAAGG